MTVTQRVWRVAALLYADRQWVALTGDLRLGTVTYWLLRRHYLQALVADALMWETGKALGWRAPRNG